MIPCQFDLLLNRIMVNEQFHSNVLHLVRRLMSSCRALGPSPARPVASGPGRASTQFCGPGLGLHFGGSARAWAAKILNTSGLGRAWA